MSDRGPFLFLLYFALKYAGYAAWCWVGIRLLDPGRERRLGAALRYGLVRFLLGFGFGILIFGLSNVLWPKLYAHDVPFRQTIVYLAVYVPVRWIEWSILATLIDRAPASAGAFLFGSGSRSRLWRVGGILVSCVADIPMLLDGLPVGRFLC